MKQPGKLLLAIIQKQEVSFRCLYPVPGGVGSVTTAIFARHVVASSENACIRVKVGLPHGNGNNHKELTQRVCRGQGVFACYW